MRAQQPPVAPVWAPQPDDAIALALALRCRGRAPMVAARVGGPTQPCELHMPVMSMLTAADPRASMPHFCCLARYPMRQGCSITSLDKGYTVRLKEP